MAMYLHAAIASTLKDLGVDTLYGVIGEGNLYIVDSFRMLRACRYVAAGNENGAALMASGHAQVDGSVAFATVTHGPGLTNATTALVECVRNRTPVVLLAGDTPADEPFHLQAIDQQEVVLATGALWEPVAVAEEALVVLRRAHERASAERRPVVVNLPADLQFTQVEYQATPANSLANPPAEPSDAELDAAVGLLASSTRPLILAGAGALSPHAQVALIELARRRGALLATTLRAKGLFDEDPFALGVFGTFSSPVAIELIAQADCIAAFGASLNVWTTASGDLLRNARILHCDIDSSQLGLQTSVDVKIAGDAATVATTMERWLAETGVPASKFRSERNAAKLAEYVETRTRAQQSQPSSIDGRSVMERVDHLMPADRTLVTDGGRYLYQTIPAVRSAPVDGFPFALSFGAIGAGLATAIGAGMARPTRPVLHVSGDGGFMLGGLAEFSTAVRYDVDLVVVVLNDGSYGSEHMQLKNRGMSTDVSLVDWPELAPVADALGGTGVSVRGPSDLDRIDAALRDAKRPLLIDVKLDPNSMVTEVS